MTDGELIAKQAREIAELREYREGAQEAFKTIVNNCVCIGGPLNDNFLRYSKEQLAVFYRIEGEAKSWIDRSCDC